MVSQVEGVTNLESHSTTEFDNKMSLDWIQGDCWTSAEVCALLSAFVVFDKDLLKSSQLICMWNKGDAKFGD